MKKEKTVKTHTRKTKSGKTVTVKQHTAKYDAAEEAKDIVRKAGAGKELEKVRMRKSQRDPFEGFDFTEEDFAEWYEGTGSKADKRVEKALKKMLGKDAYNDLNDYAADHYKKGGARKFFEAEVMDGRSPGAMKKAGTFYFEENTGGKHPQVFKYEGKFVTDKKGKTKMMLRDTEEGGDYFDAVHAGYDKLSDFPASVQEAAQAKGLTFKDGEWISKGATPVGKKESKGKSSEEPKKVTVNAGPYGTVEMIKRKELGVVGKTKYYVDSAGNVYKKNHKFGAGDAIYTKLSASKASEIMGKISDQKGKKEAGPKKETSADLRRRADEMDAAEFRKHSREIKKRTAAEFEKTGIDPKELKAFARSKGWPYNAEKGAFDTTPPRTRSAPRYSSIATIASRYRQYQRKLEKDKAAAPAKIASLEEKGYKITKVGDKKYLHKGQIVYDITGGTLKVVHTYGAKPGTWLQGQVRRHKEETQRKRDAADARKYRESLRASKKKTPKVATK